jgi:hypothetical protein
MDLVVRSLGLTAFPARRFWSGICRIIGWRLRVAARTTADPMHLPMPL